MDEHEVARQLRLRSDPASRAAVERLDAGARWLQSVDVVRTDSVHRDWSRPDEPYSDLAFVGLAELLRDLAATEHSTLDEVMLDYTPPGVGLGDRFVVYLAQGTNLLVGCVGVVPAPRPPTPVFDREEVPDTIGGAAEAFLSYRRPNGHPVRFEVTVRRELGSTDAEQLYLDWPQRTKGWYSDAPSISVLGAAEVSVAEPKGERFDGYLLILDISPVPESKRHRHGRVDALLLKTDSRGTLGLRVVNCFQYRAEAPPAA